MKKLNNAIHMAIVSSTYRPEITKSLVNHCVKTLEEHGLTRTQLKIVYVPGALEIPLIAKKLAQTKKYDAIIVFGAVLKGKTYHFKQVANECIRGCMNISSEFEIPVVFEVLCVYDLEDAIERATGTKDNRGVEGALTALKMINVLRNL